MRRSEGSPKRLRAANQRPQPRVCAQKSGFSRLAGVQNLQIICGTWLSSPELLRKLLGPSMLLVEIAEPLLGRRRSAVLMPMELLAAVLQRNWASVETGWPAVLAVRRFFLQGPLVKAEWMQILPPKCRIA